MEALGQVLFVMLVGTGLLFLLYRLWYWCYWLRKDRSRRR